MGFFIVTFASILFGTFPSIQKHVLATGVSPLALVIICNTLAALLALTISVIQGKSLKVNRRQLLSLLLIGALGLFTTDYLLNIAYTLIPVGYVTMIHFMYPSLVCVVMCVLFREKMNLFKGLAIAASVSGLVLLAGGGFSGSAAGLAVAAVTAVTYTFYMIATEKTAAGEVDPLVRVFYTNIAVTITASAVAGVSRTKLVFPNTPVVWGQSVLIGVMLCCAIFLINKGVQMIGANNASFINMVEPVTSMVVSILAYHYAVKPLAILGCLLIVSSLIFTAKADKAADTASEGNHHHGGTTPRTAPGQMANTEHLS